MHVLKNVFLLKFSFYNVTKNTLEQKKILTRLLTTAKYKQST